jgi:putative transposase
MNETREEQIRQEALRLHLSGLAATEICRQLGRSRVWFHKWKARFDEGEADWFKDHSRAPESVSNKTPDELEKQVLSIRARLEKTTYSQIGAFTIQWEMKNLGLKPLPTWTINRILKRHNVVREKKRYQPKNTPYPDDFSDSVQQADLVGPRYIKKDGRFYSMNVVDLETRMVAVHPCRTKADEDMARGLLHSFKSIGRPDYIQFDNAWSLFGSPRHPRSLGLIPRLCLALGVRVIFIPIGEPWRNGSIERFQNTFDKTFYHGQFFPSYAHMKRKAAVFERFVNTRHPSRALKGKTPAEYVASSGMGLRLLDKAVHLKDIDLSLADGEIALIRLIRSDLKLDVFSEKFPMPRKVQYEYVVATILTEQHVLRVTQDNQEIRSFEYRMPIDYQRY